SLLIGRAGLPSHKSSLSGRTETTLPLRAQRKTPLHLCVTKKRQSSNIQLLLYLHLFLWPLLFVSDLGNRSEPVHWNCRIHADRFPTAYRRWSCARKLHCFFLFPGR